MNGGRNTKLVIGGIIVVILFIVGVVFQGLPRKESKISDIDPNTNTEVVENSQKIEEVEHVTPELAAFAGCEGYGCETAGGRGGDLYIITSTDDSGPGTLREALETSGPRYIITQVDGVVELTSEIKISSGGITLDLRRPPLGGLSITGKPITFQSVENVVALGLRYRGSESNCINLNSVQSTIIAHSSFFGCSGDAVNIDNSSSSGVSSDITLQNNLFLEHGSVSLYGEWDNVSIQSNAFVGNKENSPSISGCGPECLTAGSKIFIGYNLISNWDDHATSIGLSALADIVGNIYIPGLVAQSSAIEVVDLPEEESGTTMYIKDNKECASAESSCEVASVDTSGGIVSSSPLTDISITPITSNELRSDDWLKTLGSGTWDDEDHRVVEEFFAGTAVVGGGYDSETYIVPAPEIGSVIDTDLDGIPDTVDPNPDTFSAWEDTNGDQWSDLEAYMNQLSIK